MPVATPVSIVVPAFREAQNLTPLVERIFAATDAAMLEAELIIVDDDSADGSEEIVAELAKRFPVHLNVRKGERGLSGAVLRGFTEAKHNVFVVLDADLQHPPEAIPAMVDGLAEPACDFAIATRYAGSGGIAGDWPLSRRIASWLATVAARPLARVTDPMSGFFATRRDTWQRAGALNPTGYKIALELIVRARCKHITEVPIEFAARTAGESKASFSEGIRYAKLLAQLYWMRFPLLWIGLAVAASVAIWLALGL